MSNLESSQLFSVKFRDSTLHEELKRQLEILISYIFNNLHENIGLFDGNLGHLLLANEIAGHDEVLINSDLNIFFHRFNKDIIEKKRNIDFTFTHGLSGLYSTFMLCNQESDYAKVDKYFQFYLNQLIIRNNFDPITGFPSVGRYFLLRSKCHDVELPDGLKDIGKLISPMLSSYNGEKVFRTLNTANNRWYINLGMAHGSAGVLSFLLDCFQIHKCPKIEKSILDIADSTLSLIEKNCGCTYFDNSFQDGYNERRQSWCYGELTVLYVLLRVMIEFKLTEKYKILIARVENVLKRDVCYKHYIDPMFCHGTVGTLYTVKRIGELVGGEIDCQTYMTNLLNYTFSTFYENEVFGYRYAVVDNGQIVKRVNTGLLEGLTGVALVFLSIIYDQQTNWDFALMYGEKRK